MSAASELCEQSIVSCIACNGDLRSARSLTIDSSAKSIGLQKSLLHGLTDGEMAMQGSVVRTTGVMAFLEHATGLLWKSRSSAKNRSALSDVSKVELPSLPPTERRRYFDAATPGLRLSTMEAVAWLLEDWTARYPSYLATIGWNSARVDHAQATLQRALAVPC
jgi:hypothetical protein